MKYLCVAQPASSRLWMPNVTTATSSLSAAATCTFWTAKNNIPSTFVIFLTKSTDNATSLISPTSPSTVRRARTASCKATSISSASPTAPAVFSSKPSLSISLRSIITCVRCPVSMSATASWCAAAKTSPRPPKSSSTSVCPVSSNPMPAVVPSASAR